MTTLATPTTTRPQVGKRTELGRYTLPDGTVRLVIGQRIDGSVRFLPGNRAVLVSPSQRYEDDRCRSRAAALGAGRPNAARHKRLNGASAQREPRKEERS